MYQEDILDHYKHPRNYGTLAPTDIVARDSNPLCGDEVTFTATVADGTIKDIQFTAQGCAISIAASSKLSEAVKGKSLHAVQDFHTEDIIDLLGIPLSPMRITCAVLGLMTLQKGIAAYTGGKR